MIAQENQISGEVQQGNCRNDVIFQKYAQNWTAENSVWDARTMGPPAAGRLAKGSGSSRAPDEPLSLSPLRQKGAGLPAVAQFLS
jgi:hypothetical protein